MAIGAVALYHAALLHLLRGGWGDLEQRPLSAILLTGQYTPDLAVHSHWSHVLAYQPVSPDYRPQPALNSSLSMLSESVSFQTDAVSFGEAVTIQDVRYFALVLGTASNLLSSDRLLGYVDLSPGGGTRESYSAPFSVHPPSTGWFTLQQGVAQ